MVLWVVLRVLDSIIVASNVDVDRQVKAHVDPQTPDREGAHLVVEEDLEVVVGVHQEVEVLPETI